VQTMVEQKVQRYLPEVKISVPDDIGNENVSVGSPISGTQIGGGNMSLPPQGDCPLAPPHESYSGQDHTQHGYGNPSQYQDNQQYRAEPNRQFQDHQSQQYPPEDYRPEHFAPPEQSYYQQSYPQQDHSQQDYRGGQYSGRDY
jgi:hypothetical protein